MCRILTRNTALQQTILFFEVLSNHSIQIIHFQNNHARYSSVMQYTIQSFMPPFQTLIHPSNSQPVAQFHSFSNHESTIQTMRLERSIAQILTKQNVMSVKTITRDLGQVESIGSEITSSVLGSKGFEGINDTPLAASDNCGTETIFHYSLWSIMLYFQFVLLDFNLFT